MQIGGDDDFAADQLFGIVGCRDSGYDGAGFGFAGIDLEVKQLVRAFDALGREDAGDAQIDFDEVFDVDLRGRRRDGAFRLGLLCSCGAVRACPEVSAWRAVSSSSSARMRSMALLASMRGKTGAISPMVWSGFNCPQASLAISSFSIGSGMPSCVQMLAVDSGRMDA